MKWIYRAQCVLGLVLSSAAMAADPVEVTIYTEGSFVRAWGNQANATAKKIFDDAAKYYKDNFNIDMTLAGIEAPSFNTETQVAGVPTDSRTIMYTLRRNLKEKRGTSLAVLPSNWLLVHRENVVLRGQVDSIGGLSFEYPNLFINTIERSLSGFFGTTACPTLAARKRTAAELRHTAIHEFGHLLAAVHPTPDKCSNQVMCNQPDAQCLQKGVWQIPGLPLDTHIATNAARIRAHRDCYMSTVFRWDQCFRDNVP